MITNHKRAVMTTFWLLLVASLISQPVLSHDPLKSANENQHNNDHSPHQYRTPQPADLVRVRALVVSFRETGDDRHLDEAWSLLLPSLATASPDSETLIAASFVAQSRHRFDEAIALIDRALTISNNNDEAWLLLASIQLVVGKTQAAAEACRNLRKVPPLVLLTCKARVALANGDHEVAFDRLRSLLDVVDSKRLSPDLLAWSYSVAGDLAVASAERDHATRLYRQSLGLVERTQVRAALVDVLLLDADHDIAWQTLEDGSLALPLLVRRLIVAKRLGRSQTLQATLSKVQREFERWIADEDWLHAREMSRFYIDVVDQPELARRLALINITLQQESEDRRLEERTRPVA